MQIAYIGNFRPSHSTETHVAASLEALGHEVLRIQEDESDIPKRDRLVWGTDLLLWTRTWTECWQQPFAKADPLRWFESLHARGVPTVSLHLDLYAGLQRGEGLHTDPFWRTQYVFTPDDGAPEFFARHGVAHYYQPPGVYHAECFRAEPRDYMRTDVLFVGSGFPGGGYHPEWSYRGELLQFLLQHYGDRFAKWGGPALGGRPEAPAQPFVRGDDLNALYTSAGVVVGDTLCLGPEDQVAPRFTHAGYWSDRIHETMGRGGLFVHPRIAGLDDLFEHGKHLLFYEYGNFEDLTRCIDSLLADPERAEQIRQAGHDETKRKHTYLHRCASMLARVAQQEAKCGRDKLLSGLQAMGSVDVEPAECPRALAYVYDPAQGIVAAQD